MQTIDTVFKIALTTNKRNAMAMTGPTADTDILIVGKELSATTGKEMAMAGPKADTDIRIVGQDAAFVTDRKANTEIIVEGNEVTRAGVHGVAFRGRMTDDDRKAAAAKYLAISKRKQMEFEGMSPEQNDSLYGGVYAVRARVLSDKKARTAVAASSAKDAEDGIVGAKRHLLS